METPNDALKWNAWTLVRGGAAAVFGLLLAKGGEWIGVGHVPWYAAYVFGAACGAMAVLIKQREKPVVVFLVFVPVLFVLLLAGALLFHIYVLRNPIEL